MDDDVIQTVADAVVEQAAAETAAVTAQAAAESTVVAAETAIALANAQSAQAQADAARQVQIIVDDVEQVEVNVLWLRHELEAHQTADREWKNRMEAALQQILEVTRELMQPTLESLDSTPQTLASGTEVQNPSQVPPQTDNPQNAGAADRPAAGNEKPRKEKFKLL